MSAGEVEELQSLLGGPDWFELAWAGSEIDGFKTVETIDGGDGRWSRNVTVITRGPSGRHYRWNYDHGLTEYQEHDRSDETIREVTPVEKTVVVREWVVRCSIPT